jgi:hypothetical protein
MLENTSYFQKLKIIFQTCEVQLLIVPIKYGGKNSKSNYSSLLILILYFQSG